MRLSLTRAVATTAAVAGTALLTAPAGAQAGQPAACAAGAKLSFARVQLFKDASCGGPQVVIRTTDASPDRADLTRFRNFDGTIRNVQNSRSSLLIARGTCVRLYDGVKYSGAASTNICATTGDLAWNLARFDDRASSIRVFAAGQGAQPPAPGGGNDGSAPTPNPTPAPPAPAPAQTRPSWVPAKYWPLIQRAAKAEGLDARLIAAQLWVESKFNPTIKSPAGAYGIAQFLPSTWRSSSNPYRAHKRGYLVPKYAIPAQARLMKNLQKRARGENAAAIRARLAKRSDIPASTLNAIDFQDPYQIALMAYHGGWDLSGWGPLTSQYPVNIYEKAQER